MMKRFLCLLLALCMLPLFSLAEEDLEIEEIIEDVLIDEEGNEVIIDEETGESFILSEAQHEELEELD